MQRKLTRIEFLKASGAAGAGAAYLAATPGTALAQSGSAPGRPGEEQFWTLADKDGFGTSANTDSRVWYTLNAGRLTEVYYPDLGTPSVYELQFVVTDGESFAHTEREDMDSVTRLEDAKALLYCQVNTDYEGRYRLRKRYVTDPSRDTLLMQVSFESLDGKDYELYAVYNPALDNGALGDSASTQGGSLSAEDGQVASALACSVGFSKTSNGYAGESGGLKDLLEDCGLDATYRTARDGNVVQSGQIELSGGCAFTLALGFGKNHGQAQENAAISLDEGFWAIEERYRAGWHEYLSGLCPPPVSVGSSGYFWCLYNVSVMVLHASEDKTYRGAHVASPSMPWAWGDGESVPSAAYHLVWSRDLYQSATALIAAGDTEAAERSLDFLFERQQKGDGSFPQNSTVQGVVEWEELQLDEVAFPLVLAWQLERNDARTYYDHIRPAADFIVKNGPNTPQERWENQGGYSPATIAAEIAGLVCAAEIAQVNGDGEAASRYLGTADEWQGKVEGWTVTENGPLSESPYYLRITKSGDPNEGTTYDIGDSGPSSIDQRRVVDPSYLELVRLGVKPADDENIVGSLDVIDRELAVELPSGTNWHRFSYDGYGETREGEPWDIAEEGSPRTLGRAWPLFAGERGEYELAAGEDAIGRLWTIAGAANEGLMLPEQVWDGRPPTGKPGFEAGKGTFSATPLSWTHAQYVRLAWSLDAGCPVEQPRIVADRYLSL